MSVVGWFIVGVGAAALLAWWRFCVQLALHDRGSGTSGDLVPSMLLGVLMVPLSVAWVPVVLWSRARKSGAGARMGARVRKAFPPPKAFR